MGDDDTLWLLHGVQRLLSHYDPQLPYWISDSVAELQVRSQGCAGARRLFRQRDPRGCNLPSPCVGPSILLFVPQSFFSTGLPLPTSCSSSPPSSQACPTPLPLPPCPCSIT